VGVDAVAVVVAVKAEAAVDEAALKVAEAVLEEAVAAHEAATSVSVVVVAARAEAAVAEVAVELAAAVAATILRIKQLRNKKVNVHRDAHMLYFQRLKSHAYDAPWRECTGANRQRDIAT